MDDVNLIFFIKCFVQNSIYHAMWKNSIGPHGSIFKWSNMDDWDYKFHKKNDLFIIWFQKFQSGALVPHDNKRMVTILITSFGK
jgi:hypothetical protein